MKRAALYMRVSTVDQNPATQLHDLRQLANQRGLRSSRSTPTRSVARKRSDLAWINSCAMPTAAVSMSS